MRAEPELLNEAVPLYYGAGLSPYPKADALRLIERYGSDLGQELAARIEAIGRDLDSLVPNWTKHDVQSGTEWAIGLLRRMHPALNEEAAKVWGWAYSYGWK